MEILVKSRCKIKRDFIHTIATFYAQSLNIADSKYSITIYNQSNLQKNYGHRGNLGVISERHLGMTLDSRLSVETLIHTLAHEMIHAKQRVRGQLKHRFKKNGKVEFLWCGKAYDKDYYDSPWEIDAFKRERILANKVAQIVKNS